MGRYPEPGADLFGAIALLDGEPIEGLELVGGMHGDRSRTHVICGVVDLLTVENGPAVDLFDDIPDMDRRGGRAAIYNRLAVGPQVVRCNLA